MYFLRLLVAHDRNLEFLRFIVRTLQKAANLGRRHPTLQYPRALQTYL